MNCFVVISEDNIEVKEKFPEHSYEITKNAWVVAASEDKTASDISDILNIKTGQCSGAVFELSDYYGLYSKALWQKLGRWMS